MEVDQIWTKEDSFFLRHQHQCGECYFFRSYFRNFSSTYLLSNEEVQSSSQPVLSFTVELMVLFVIHVFPFSNLWAFGHFVLRSEVETYRGGGVEAVWGKGMWTGRGERHLAQAALGIWKLFSMTWSQRNVWWCSYSGTWWLLLQLCGPSVLNWAIPVYTEWNGSVAQTFEVQLMFSCETLILEVLTQQKKRKKNQFTYGLKCHAQIPQHIARNKKITCR